MFFAFFEESSDDVPQVVDWEGKKTNAEMFVDCLDEDVMWSFIDWKIGVESNIGLIDTVMTWTLNWVDISADVETGLDDGVSPRR